MSKRKPATKKKRPPPASLKKHHDGMREHCASFLTAMIGQPGFEELLDFFREVIGGMSIPEQQRFTALMNEKLEIIKHRQENGETLAAEGRAAKALADKKRAQDVCRLYRLVRRSFPAGGAGNARAILEVADRHQRSSRRDRPLTPQAIRKILRQQGVDCR